MAHVNPTYDDPPLTDYDPDEAWDYPPYIPPGTQGYQGWEDVVSRYEDIDYGTIGEPVPIMSMLGQTFGMKNIIQYMKNQFSGRGVGRRVDKYRELGLGRVNRAATKYYDKMRGKSAAEGGRGSSYAAATMARGVGELAGQRADIETGAMGYEDRLRGQAWERGTGVAKLLETAIRGDEKAQRAMLQQVFEQAELQQSALGAEADIYGDMAGFEQNEAYRQQIFVQLRWEMEHGGDKDKIMEYIGILVKGGFDYAAATA